MAPVRHSVLVLASVGIFALTSPLHAATIDILATADGEVILTGGVPGSVSQLQGFNLSQNVVTNQEVRSIYEFDLPVLTESIISATFLGAVTQNSAPPAVLSFFGYAGNGTIDGSDAIQTSTLLGSTILTTQVPTGTSIPISVSLLPSFIDALGSGFLGLTTTATMGDTVLVASLESTAAVQRPTLRLETAEVPPPSVIPEPGTMLLVAGGFAALSARRRRKRQ